MVKNPRLRFASILVILAVALALPGGLRFPAYVRAQETTKATDSSQSINKAELHQALLDLTNPWTVMCIAAHPDDEDGTSLIVMRRKYGAHTVSLFSTFGEGGQNAIGPELYEELGAIRARETMAAAEIQGSEPYFLGLKDFGFSKSADEAFRVWGHDEALRRMVLQIRKLRPDVIITNHSATNNDHGHHQATARLELEAFDAAAYPKRFPEQLKDGVTAWQIQRLFVRVGRSNQTQAETAPVVTIDPNELDPIRGKVYAEEALQALQKHATQGPWPKTVAQMASRFTNSSNGLLPIIRYRLVREAKGAGALSKDSHNFLDGLRLPEEIARQLELPTIDSKALTASVDQRRQLLDALVGIRKDGKLRPEKSNEPLRFLRMDHRLDAAFAAVTNITAKTTPRDEVVTPGLRTAFTVTMSNNGDLPATVYSTTFFAGPRNVKTLYSGSAPFPPGDTGSVTDDWTIPPETVPSLPHPQHLYDGRIFGDEFKEVVTINLADIQFSVTGSAHVDVAPSVEVTSITPQTVIATGQNPSPYFSLRITNHQNERFRGRVIPRLVARCKSIACGEAGFEDTVRLGLLRLRGEPLRLERDQSIDVRSAISLIGLTVNKPETDRNLNWPYQLVFQIQRITRDGSWETIGESIPVMLSFADAKVVPNLRVGYVRGFDYSLPNALAALGVKSKELSIDEVKTADLQKYGTIIVDNRVYESQPELITANQKLLDYAKDGGTLIVFYHKSFEWNPDERRKRPQLAPYKLILGDERITDETAPITFIEPQHPLLNLPNKIGQEDFANWIQERGLYYPKEWDPHYSALFSTNDPGEAPLNGGLLVAHYGKGNYIYTSMVWYRELRAGVPGAYRMLGNMISYGHK